MTIDNVESGGGGGGGGTTSLSLSAPADVNEGAGFMLTAQLSTPGTYQINAMVNWGTTPGAGQTNFSGTTNSDGSFTVGYQYFDDGPANGNGTPQDVQSISLTGTATKYTMQGPVYIPLSGAASTTIHNVAPTPVFDIYNYMPIGGPEWVVSGAYQDVGLADKGTITVDWGDGSAPLVFAGVSTGFTFNTVSSPHRYPPDGLSYTIVITITDDDTGEVSFAKDIGLYLFDLDNDANNNGEIDSTDEEFEGLSPETQLLVNSDDDNGDDIPDMSQNGPIPGENDLEPFEVKWQEAFRPDIDNYFGWHVTLNVWPHQMPDQFFSNPRIWTTPNKSGNPVELNLNSQALGGYAKSWTVGGPNPEISGDGNADELPKTLYLEARAPGSIGMQLRLWTPNWEEVESDFVAFYAGNAKVKLHIGNGMTHEYVPENHKFDRGAFTVSNHYCPANARTIFANL